MSQTNIFNPFEFDETEKEAFGRDGHFLLPGILTSETCKQLTRSLALIQPFRESKDPQLRHHSGHAAEYDSYLASLIAHPQMPYTEALINSAPLLSNPPHTRLTAIPGLPPNLLNVPDGCRFHARCPYVQDKCTTDLPDLITGDNPGHSYACWHPIANGRARHD